MSAIRSRNRSHCSTIAACTWCTASAASGTGSSGWGGRRRYGRWGRNRAVRAGIGIGGVEREIDPLDRRDDEVGRGEDRDVALALEQGEAAQEVGGGEACEPVAAAGQRQPAARTRRQRRRVGGDWVDLDHHRGRHRLVAALRYRAGGGEARRR